MESLSSEQIERIRIRIRHEGIRRNDLENDLLDHLCCLVEREMQTSEDFEEALNTVWGDFAPTGGLRRIQSEVNFTLYDKIRSMKKTLFFLSAFGLVFFFASALVNGFGLASGYESDFMINLAFINQYFICLLVLPLYWYRQFKGAQQQEDGLGKPAKSALFLSGFLCSEALVTAVFFKLMCMPGGNQLFMASAVLGMIYVPLYTVRRYRIDF